MAVLSAGMKCLKATVVILNFLFIIFAIGLVSLGAYVLVKFSEYSPSMQRTWQLLPIMIIILGCFVFIVSFLGCCGAVKENRCMLYLYGTLLIIILIGEIAAAVMAIVYKDQVEAKLDELFKKAIVDYYENPEIAHAVDLIQKTFKCCGASNSDDYKGKIPPSCEFYSKGCVSQVEPFFKKWLVIAAIIIFAAVFFHLFITVVAYLLAAQVRLYEAV